MSLKITPERVECLSLTNMKRDGIYNTCDAETQNAREPNDKS